MTFGRLFVVVTSLLVLFIVLFLLAYHIFPLKYAYEINRAARENSVSPFLISAIIKQESNFDEKAMSYAGAFGLMQLMPDTGKWLKEISGVKGSWMDIRNNIYLGAYYVNHLREMFGDDEAVILTAYSRGPGTVKELFEKGEFKENLYAKRVRFFKKIYEILYSAYLEDDN